MNVLLIAGGWSSERPVSLSGAKGIEASLQRLGHQVTFFDPEHSLSGLADAVKGQDFAFINLHGCPGEDGLIQAMLEMLDCPYQGSGPAGSFLALNKAAAKELFRNDGLPTADWQLLTEKPAPGWRPDFAFPVFIKANTGGSSLDLSRVEEPEDLDGALEKLFAKGREFLIEPAITGVEVTCGVLGHEALPPILIRPKANSAVFFDYASKYSAGGAEELCPAPLSAAINANAQALALRVHKLLGLSGYSRSDFILDANENLWLLEVNTLPGMTGTSLIPREAAAIGLGYDDLVARLIELGLSQHKCRPKRHFGN